MRSVIERIVLGAVLGGVLGALPLFSAGAETAAEVLSATGSALAVSAEGQRPLECSGLVRDGERIVTDESSRAGLLAGDVYVQLDHATSVIVRRTEAGAPLLEITSGRVRLVDTSAGDGSAFEIRTRDSRAAGRGNDTEVTVSQLGTELCEARADLDVAGLDGDGSLVARPGQCVTAHGGEPLVTAPRGESRIALSGAEGCIQVAVVDHFLPDVAAPPPTIGLAPLDPDRMTYGPCDDPGSGCMRINPAAGVVRRPTRNGGDNGGGGFGFNTGPGERP
jgi:hypothetical protein